MLQPHETWNVIDSSKLNTFLGCPRQYFYEYLLGWRSATPNHHLIFGEALHAALEVLYRHGFDQLELAKMTFLERYRRQLDPMTDDLYFPKTPNNAFEVLDEYVTYRYPDDLQKYKVLAVEVSGMTPIAPDLNLYFRQDVILRDRATQQIFTLEHKTSSRGGSTWFDQWPLSIQVGTYTHALYGAFPHPEVYGVRINGMIFLKKETKFERVPCAKTPAQMEVWRATVISHLDHLLEQQKFLLEVQDILETQPTLTLFPLRPTECTRWGTCIYHDFCASWPNPLQHCDEVPIGFVQEFWDPRSR